MLEHKSTFNNALVTALVATSNGTCFPGRV
jgi:hypothetical protein